MKVCVVGLWHLGTVTAACLASGGHEVVGLDFDVPTIHNLQAGQPPLFEPGLEDLVKRGLAEGRLRFTTDIVEALANTPEVIWVAYDTPVDDDDHADVEFVIEQVTRLFPFLPHGATVLISAQLPVGTAQRLEKLYAAARPEAPVSFACSPENLRLGKAIQVFTQPDRVVIGIRAESDRARLAALFQPFTDRLEWMSVESAEMTKHALNAFLAVSVTFINELATLCEQVGADAKEVERGLKSEARIGPRAYLGPGGAFAGGTLARDIAFLNQIGEQHQQSTALLAAVRQSNDAHKNWAQRKLQQVLGDLRGRTIAVWGLTYKPGTDTLRRSSAVELCAWLHAQGARVQAHDPAVKTLPAELAAQINLCPTPLAAAHGADAVVVATEWPEYKDIRAAELSATLAQPMVVDVARFLAKTLENQPHLRYAAVGKAQV